jgi:hypothetical protein
VTTLNELYHNKTLIALTSITYAIKAKNLLNSTGYYCEIQRTPKELAKGCGYSIIVKNDINLILSILASENIKVKDYMSL